MEDNEIIALYFARSEDAVARTAEKYGGLLRTVAGNILRNEQDRDECVQDAYLRAWETIPPTKPNSLGAYLACVTRSISLSHWRRDRAEKRGGQVLLRSLDELGDCVPAPDDTAAAADSVALAAALNRFLGKLRELDRRIFLQRYWYFCPVADIARCLGVGESRVKVSLHRSREALRVHLEREGITL